MLTFPRDKIDLIHLVLFLTSHFAVKSFAQKVRDFQDSPKIVLTNDTFLDSEEEWPIMEDGMVDSSHHSPVQRARHTVIKLDDAMIKGYTPQKNSIGGKYYLVHIDESDHGTPQISIPSIQRRPKYRRGHGVARDVLRLPVQKPDPITMESFVKKMEHGQYYGDGSGPFGGPNYNYVRFPSGFEQPYRSNGRRRVRPRRYPWTTTQATPVGPPLQRPQPHVNTAREVGVAPTTESSSLWQDFKDMVQSGVSRMINFFVDDPPEDAAGSSSDLVEDNLFSSK